MQEPKAYDPSLVAYAARCGIRETDLPLIINGCSGGLSWAYRLAFGRSVSCESCCDWHDVLYFIGGTEADRKRADRQLRNCVRHAGIYPDGLIGRLRRASRWLRSWLMYFAVRGFGRRYWNDSPF